MKYLLTFLLFFSVSSHAENEVSQQKQEVLPFKEFCNSEPCRKNVTIRLKQENGSIYENTFELLPPVIQPRFISIYAGETIYIEADDGGSKPINLVHVKALKEPDKTIIFKFEQIEAKSGDTQMMFTTKHPFSKRLRFNMGIMPLSKENLLKTSSCPVRPKRQSIELWPYPIFQVALANLRFLEEDASHVCEK